MHEIIIYIAYWLLLSCVRDCAVHVAHLHASKEGVREEVRGGGALLGVAAEALQQKVLAGWRQPLGQRRNAVARANVKQRGHLRPREWQE